MASQSIKCFYGLTGTGTGEGNLALDGWPVADIKDNDFALGSAGDAPAGKFYIYQYDSASTEADSSPYVIIPNDNSSGTGAWILSQAYMSDLNLAVEGNASNGINMACSNATDAGVAFNFDPGGATNGFLFALPPNWVGTGVVGFDASHLANSLSLSDLVSGLNINMGLNGGDFRVYSNILSAAGEMVRVCAAGMKINGLNTDPRNTLDVLGGVWAESDQFDDSFMGAIKGQWTQISGSTGTTSLQSVAGGAYKLNSSATASSYEGIDFGGVRTFVNTRQPKHEWVIELEQTTNIEAKAELKGSNAGDFIRFKCDASDDANWHFMVSKNGGTTASASGSAFTANKVKLRVSWNSDTSITWSIDDVDQSTIATATAIPTELLEPSIQVHTEEGAERELDIHRFRISQDAT